MKECKTCLTMKAFEEYHKSDRCTDGYRGVCKSCARIGNRSRYDKEYKGGMGHNQGRIEMPSQEILKSMFDLVDGKLIRKVSAGNSKAGSVVGVIRKDGYSRVWACGVHALVHRLVWKMETGQEPPKYLDHVNGDRSDNRIENLREADHAINMWNQSIRKSNTTGFTGVSMRAANGAWVAAITVNKKRICLGTHVAIENALMAYEDGCRKYHGIYADRKIEHNKQEAKRQGIAY